MLGGAIQKAAHKPWGTRHVATGIMVNNGQADVLGFTLDHPGYLPAQGEVVSQLSPVS